MARFGDSRLRETLGKTTRNLSAADTVVHSIDVTGLGGDRSLTQTAASENLGRDTTNRESLGFFARRDRRPALRQRQRPEARARRDARDDEPLLRARDPAGAREGAGRLPQAQGQGRAQGREALAPSRLLRAQRVRRLADDAAAPVRPRRAASSPGRAATTCPSPACACRSRRRTTSRRSGSWSRCRATRCPGRGASRCSSRCTATRWRDDGGVRDHLAQSLKLEPARADPAGTGARRLGLRDLRGAARPLHDPDHGARGDERQERRAHPRRDGAALRRALGVRAAAARARRAGALAQARDRPRPGRRRRQRRRPSASTRPRSSRARASRSIRAVASGWC